MKKKHSLFLLLPAVAMICAGCNGKEDPGTNTGGNTDSGQTDDDHGGGEQQTVAVTGVTLNKNAATIEVGETETLVATVAPENATNKNVTWESSAPAVATVANGVVTAVAPGNAVIKVKTADGNKEATCAVTVAEAEQQTVAVTDVSLDATAKTLEVGGSFTLHATVSPENASNKQVSWSSDAAGVATVVDGVVTAVAPGTAHITVTTTDGNKTAQCTVTVNEPAPVVVNVTGVTLDKETAKVAPTKLVTLVPTVAPANASNKAVTWESENTEVATVVDGVVTGVADGKTNIKVKTVDGNFEASCEVTVAFTPKITINDTNGTTPLYPTIKIGDPEYQINAVVSEANGAEGLTDLGLIYAKADNSNEHITLSEDGKVTAVSAGKCTVKVKSHYDANVEVSIEFNVVEVQQELPERTSNGMKLLKSTELADGMVITFVSSIGDVPYVFAGEPANFAGAAATEITDDKLVMPEGTPTYTVVKNDDSSFSFLSATGKYLASGTGSNNYLTTVASITNEAKFEVVIGEDGFIDIVSKSESPDNKGDLHNVLALNENSGNPRFACYKAASAAGYKKLAIYDADVCTGVAAVLANNAKVYNVGDQLTKEDFNVTATFKYGGDVSNYQEFTISPEYLTEVDNEITITVGGKTAIVEINGAQVPTENPTALSISGDFTKKSYIIGTDNAWEHNFEVSGTYATGDSVLSGGLYDLTFDPADPTEEMDNGSVVVTATLKADPTITTSVTITGVTVAEPSIDVNNVDKLDLTLDYLGIGTAYGDSEKNDFVATQFTTNDNAGEKSIQCNGSKSSILYNKIQFSRPIKYVKYSVGGKAAAASAKLDFCFGAAQQGEDKVVHIGADSTTYKISESNMSYVVKGEDLIGSNKYFTMKAISGATYLKTLEIGFVDYVDPVAESISLDVTTANVFAGATINLTATVLPVDAIDKTVTWSSDDETVATVANGVVTGVAAGTANITATDAKGHTATCVVTVSERTFSELTTTGGFKTAYSTEDEDFAINDLKVFANYNVGEPEEVTNYTVTWSDEFDKSVGPHTSTPTIHWDGHDLQLNAVSYAVTAASEMEEKVAVIDGSSLTGTATTGDTNKTISGIDLVFSSGAKTQTDNNSNNGFSDTNKYILIGKSGAYIYNSTATPGVITKFEITTSAGASAKVTIGVNFSDQPIDAYNASSEYTFATKCDQDTVYDCSDKLCEGAKYFWYQVTNANNSQVQFRITYLVPKTN